VEAFPNPEPLVVLIDGQPIGTVAVRDARYVARLRCNHDHVREQIRNDTSPSGGLVRNAIHLDPRVVFGAFTPTAGFEPYRPVFEAAVELARQFDAIPANEPCDYLLWDRLMAAYAEINNLGPVIAEFPVPIKEFAVESDWSVEINFEAAPTETNVDGRTNRSN